MWHKWTKTGLRKASNYFQAWIPKKSFAEHGVELSLVIDEMQPRWTTIGVPYSKTKTKLKVPIFILLNFQKCTALSHFRISLRFWYFNRKESVRTPHRSISPNQIYCVYQKASKWRSWSLRKNVTGKFFEIFYLEYHLSKSDKTFLARMSTIGICQEAINKVSRSKFLLFLIGIKVWSSATNLIFLMFLSRIFTEIKSSFRCFCTAFSSCAVTDSLAGLVTVRQ